MTAAKLISLSDCRDQRVPPALAFKPGKGHISINPVDGCRIGCPFCIGQDDPWRTGQTVQVRSRLASPAQLVEGLRRRAAEVAPLRLSLLDLCDPFEPSLEPLLIELLRGLAVALPGQAVLLTTRLAPRPGLLELIAGLDALRLSLFVSLGDATGGVVPVTPVEPRLKLLEESSRLGIHTVMLLRPLVREWTRARELRSLLLRVRHICHEVVLGGLLRPTAVEDSLRRAGWPVPAEPPSPDGQVSLDLRDEVVALAEALGVGPISEHRSCAINRHHGLTCRVAQLHREVLEPALCQFDVEPDGDLSVELPIPAPIRAVRCEIGSQCTLDVNMSDLGGHRTVLVRDDAGYCQLREAA
jgi:DNA repair photolyase